MVKCRPPAHRRDSVEPSHLGLQHHREWPAPVPGNADSPPFENLAQGSLDPDVVDALPVETAGKGVGSPIACEAMAGGPHLLDEGPIAQGAGGIDRDRAAAVAAEELHDDARTVVMAMVVAIAEMDLAAADEDKRRKQRRQGGPPN